jgi:hypothetical protein
MIFAMGAMALITLATTVIVGAHYWEMLSGVFLIAIVGLTLPDWTAWWATYWHARATKTGEEDPRVSWTSLVVSAGMSLVMILNAGAVLAVWWDDRKAAESTAQVSKSAVDLQNARNAGNTEAIKARGQIVAQMKAQGATERTVREYMKAEAERDKARTLTAAPEATSAAVSAYVSQVPEPVRKYMAFWVYIVPFLAGLIGVFAIVIAVALPGGVDFGRKQRPISFAPNQSPAMAKADQGK